MRKQVATIILGLLLCMVISMPAHAISNPLPKLDKSHLYIQDHAHVLSDTEVTQMNELGKKLEKDTGIEMLMVTMDSVDEPRRDYALKLLREYGVGKKDINNGIVIFLNLDRDHGAEDRGIEIQIGYGLEGYFTDARVGTIIDENGLEDFKKGAYNTGLKNLYRAMYDKSQDAYQHVDKNTKLTNDMGTRWYFFTHHNVGYILGYLKAVLLFLLFGIIYPLYTWYLHEKFDKNDKSDKGNYGGGRPSDTDYYGSSGSFGGGSTYSGSGGSGSSSSGGGGFGGGTGGGGGAGRGF
ncbi:TPM domain-containing protein [Staphylococcus simulans]|uniref:TPM domain-containing protein n=1 Tax=Staphylococcus simulans TaxID=1286 RepID=UPI0021D30F07|nr:TPM domain-containing protein [Staphylococcus simulans]UXV43019.1 TPM domain-containing protein [Staphylococcus simulans]